VAVIRAGLPRVPRRFDSQRLIKFGVGVGDAKVSVFKDRPGSVQPSCRQAGHMVLLCAQAGL
jgi:hypothetical protein